MPLVIIFTIILFFWNVSQMTALPMELTLGLEQKDLSIAAAKNEYKNISKKATFVDSAFRRRQILKKDKLPSIKISENGHYFIDETGKPFFWLGDTAWKIFEVLSREDADYYLKDRSLKGFNVIQAVILYSKGMKPNFYGHPAFMKNDEDKFIPNEQYFKHVDYVIDKAEKEGLYIALTPVWADFHVRKDTGLFNTKNIDEAFAYGQFLGKRYRDKNSIVWVLGGDHYDEGTIELWREMARGLKEGDKGKHLISYHPRGYKQSSKWLHNEGWLDFNMIQTGHTKHNTGYLLTFEDYSLIPAKPTVIGEAGYEGITDRLRKPNYLKPNEAPSTAFSKPLAIGEDGHENIANRTWTGEGDVPRLDDADVRRFAYVDVFAGAAGTTYGSNEVFQFWSEGKENFSDRFSCQMNWKQALCRSGAYQMQFLRKLIESRPMLNRIPDQSIIVGDEMNTLNRIQATRAEDGSYALVYTSSGADIHIDLSKLNGGVIEASWYNPRNGESTLIGEFPGKGYQIFEAPSTGVGYDWVLKLDAKQDSGGIVK